MTRDGTVCLDRDFVEWMRDECLQMAHRHSDRMNSDGRPTALRIKDFTAHNRCIAAAKTLDAALAQQEAA